MQFNNLIDTLTGNIGLLIALAGTVERISELIKAAIKQTTKKELQPYAKQALIVSISVLFCLLTKTKLNIILNVPDYLNSILSGFLVSFGSDILHTSLGFIKSLKTTQEVNANAITIGCTKKKAKE